MSDATKIIIGKEALEHLIDKLGPDFELELKRSALEGATKLRIKGLLMHEEQELVTKVAKEIMDDLMGRSSFVSHRMKAVHLHPHLIEAIRKEVDEAILDRVTKEYNLRLGQIQLEVEKRVQAISDWLQSNVEREARKMLQKTVAETLKNISEGA